MTTSRLALLCATVAMLAPVAAIAAPPPGSPPPAAADAPTPPPGFRPGMPFPPRPHCTYDKHTCKVESPDLSFVVSLVNGHVPASDNDCKLLPFCGRRPPMPPGMMPPHAGGPGTPPPQN